MSVVERVRAGDTGGAVNAEVDWLSTNCTTEYETFADYGRARSLAQEFGPPPCISLAADLVPEAIELLREDEMCADGVNRTPPLSAATLDTAVRWNEAAAYAGSVQRVCGPLAGTDVSTDDVFLNLGVDFPIPERFQIVIRDAGEQLPIRPGSRVCASGPVTLFEGTAQIQLRDPTDLEVSL